MRRICFLLTAPLSAFCLAACVQAKAGEDWPWIRIDKTPYLTLDEWQRRAGFRPFVDEPAGRILLERKTAPPLILLLDAPYALQGARFLALPQPPIRRGGEVLLSLESAERVILPALPLDERKALEHEFAEVKGRAEGGCLSSRPAQIGRAHV